MGFTVSISHTWKRNLISQSNGQPQNCTADRIENQPVLVGEFSE